MDSDELKKMMLKYIQEQNEEITKKEHEKKKLKKKMQNLIKYNLG